MPFKCPYCGNYFCHEHRLPENHNCPQIWKAKIPQPPMQTFPVPTTQDAYQHTITYAPVLPKKRLRFSAKELQDILIGAALVMAVGISFTFFEIPEKLAKDSTIQLTIALSLASFFTASFLFHEFAHKAVAQRYGLWAEFRLTLWGALITLISILSPIKLISPGAVMISGSFVDRKVIGKTAIAGPTTNIILAAIFGAATLLAPDATIAFIAGWVAYINAFLALFNLIPFSIIDGHKIFSWNKLVWALAFTAALALTILAALFFLS
jgi:Zn-dependent protease